MCKLQGSQEAKNVHCLGAALLQMVSCDRGDEDTFSVLAFYKGCTVVLYHHCQMI